MSQQQQQQQHTVSDMRYQDSSGTSPIYHSENEEVLYDVPFDFNQWKVELLAGALLAICMVLFIIGIPMLLLLPLSYLRFRYVFRNRRCYITRTAIVQTMLVPTLFLWLPNRVEKTVQLSKIVDITIQQSWLQRMFHVCTLKIQNPGQTVSANGIPISDMDLTGIQEDQAQHVKRQLLSLASRVRRGEDITMSEISIPMMEPITAGANQVVTEARLTDAVVDIHKSLLRIEKLLAASSAGGGGAATVTAGDAMV